MKRALNFLKIFLLKNKYKNKSCVIVGNGPSLKKLDLKKLDNSFVFIVNRGYFAYKMGLKKADFFIVSDPYTYHEYEAEIDQAEAGIKFYRDNVCKDFNKGIVLNNIADAKMDKGCFSKRISKGINSGYSVVLDAIQVCFYMGFSKVFLIGCDFNYKKSSTHFYGSGKLEAARKDIMPFEKVFRSFEVAKEIYEEHNRELINATQGGDLEVLKRVDFNRIFCDKENCLGD